MNDCEPSQTAQEKCQCTFPVTLMPALHSSSLSWPCSLQIVSRLQTKCFFFSLYSHHLLICCYISPFFPTSVLFSLDFPFCSMFLSLIFFYLSLSFFTISSNLLDFTPSPVFIFMAVLERSGMFHLWEHHLIVCYSSRSSTMFQTILKFAVCFF